MSASMREADAFSRSLIGPLMTRSTHALVAKSVLSNGKLYCAKFHEPIDFLLESARRACDTLASREERHSF
jgi:hypothetical protein